MARSEALNASQGSGVAGGLSSLQSQLGSGLGYAGQQTAISSNISMFGQQRQAALTRADAFGSIAGLSMQGLSMTGPLQFGDGSGGGKGGGNSGSGSD